MEKNQGAIVSKTQLKSINTIVKYLDAAVLGETSPTALKLILQTNLGKIMEAAVAETINEIRDPLGAAIFEAKMPTFSLKNDPLSHGSARGTSHSTNGLLVRKKGASSNPLTDIVISTSLPKNLTINLSLKSSFSPNVATTSIYTGSWNSILPKALLAMNDKLHWGLMRQLTFAKTVDPDIQNAIILYSLPDLIGGSGIDKADYLVKDSTFIPMETLIDFLKNNYEDSIIYKPKLKGFGMPFDAQDKSRFKALSRRDPSQKYPSGDGLPTKNRAAVTYTNYVNFHFGNLNVSIKGAALRKLIP
jgi:hypothetical protein